MRILLLVVLFCGLTSFKTVGQQHTTANKNSTTRASSAHSAALTPASLHTDTLNYGDDVKRIYVGDFEHVAFKPDSTEFGLLVGGYMKNYSESCERYLPKDKVEIMTQECAQENYTVNGYGVEQVGSRHCVSYRTVGTGRYADPQVYSLQKKMDASMAAGMMGDVLNGLAQKGGDAAAGMKKMTDEAVYVIQDMNHFIDDNGCASPATMRFQANMLRYGRGGEPIRMAGAAAALAANVKPLEKGQNYKRLVDDLILAESHAWMMNRYETGSVAVNAVQHDGSGEPREIDAGYTYSMMGTGEVGHVRVTFEGGAPACMYFSDFAETCRAPSPGVLSAYKRNQYTDANAPAYPETEPAPVRPQRTAPPTQAQTIQRPVAPAMTPQSQIAARQAGMRADAQFVLPVRTLDPINEQNASSGTFRARLDHSMVLKDAELPAGAIVYLKVVLNERQYGTNGQMYIYTISAGRVEARGKTIGLTSRPARMTRMGRTGRTFQPQRDWSSIPAGTLMDFVCKETTE